VQSVVNKRIYINGVGIISPQKTVDNSHFLDEPVSVETLRLTSVDPNYKDFIPGDMIRRMGRIIKMGIAASKISLQDADCAMPDAIITGTGLGCIEDTEKFLSSMILNKEEFLTPTSFIQSTHNTVSAQIALVLKCHNYNFTYVHRGISFESALIDGMMRINADQANTILMGSADELTSNSFAIMQRLGFWKRKPVNNLQLLDDKTRGTIAGEGAAFFVLSDQPGKNSYAVIKDIETFIYPDDISETELHINEFLARNHAVAGDIDLFITGMNGDPTFDKIYHEVSDRLFQYSGKAFFKHLCGEYHTASSFALWLAAMIMRNQRIPEVVLLRKPATRDIRNILIYNHYRNINHSLILVSKA
jgi:3-oxoacyl-[acyl-carrier-protein] synthase II